MTVNRDRLYADLDALSVEQIEAGLAGGVWGEEYRPVVQHYVLQTKLAQERVDALRATKEAALVAVSEARAASTKATTALIIAAGAMLAAMAAAFVAFLALRNWTW
jgi:hypothetical protein